MKHSYRTRASWSLLVPAIALALAACNNEETSTETLGTSTGETTTGEETSTTNTPTTNTPTSDPTETPTTDVPTTNEPTTDEPTTDPVTTTATTTGDTTTTATTTGDTTTGDTTTGDTTTGTTGDTTTGTTGDDTTGTTGETDTSTGEPLELSGVWASSNPAAFSTDALVSLTLGLDAKNATLTVQGDAVSIQSAAVVSSTGDTYVTFDAPGGSGGVAIYKDFTDGVPTSGALGGGTRVIRGKKTELVAPKGIEVLGPSGLFVVADTGAADIKVFKLTDTGDVVPQYTVKDLGGSPTVWDIHYVGNTDTLYAAGTDGVVQVYEDFKDSMGAAGPDRKIVPTELNAKISINLHGITVDSNTLYLTDVGDAMNTTDGQIFVIENVSAADDNTDVAQRIQGGGLGNPVDIELRPALPTTLFVAEKLNDQVQVYAKNILTGDFELASNLAVSKPESVSLAPSNRLVVASNPAGLDTDAALILAAPVLGNLSLSATFDRLGSINSVESLVFSPTGEGYVSFDGPLPNGGGVFVVPGLNEIAMDGPVSSLIGRIYGPKTGLVTPKGLVLNAAGDRLFVADTAALDIKVYAATTLADVAPIFELNDLGGGAVWDIAYDDASDMLFAAGVDGTVRVFENVLAGMGGAPVRIFTPTNDQDAKVSVNLHGIHYDAASDTLILSDVGSAMNAADGQIFVIADASTADGNVVVQAQLGGEATKLGNPVDVVFNGINLYVAEKSNSLVLRFDGVLALAGFNNSAASVEIAVPGAESVALAYTAP